MPQTDVEETTRIVSVFNDVDVNIVDKVKFLGVNASICDKNNVAVAEFLPNVTKLLSFYATGLNRTAKMMYRMKSIETLNKCMDTMSQSVASLIESRIQYSIAFLDKKSLIKAINLHKRTICSISGSYFRYFGFKNLDELGDNFVGDLYGFLDLRTSETYTRLCKALGRPTLLQIAYRAVKVLLEQGDVVELISDYNDQLSEIQSGETRYKTRQATALKVPEFIKKLHKFMECCKTNGVDNTKPRHNAYFRKYRNFDTYSKRICYLKTLTNTLLIDHVDSKGWDSKTPGCRFKNCGNENENLEHVMTRVTRGM